MKTTDFGIDLIHGRAYASTAKLNSANPFRTEIRSRTTLCGNVLCIVLKRLVILGVFGLLCLLIPHKCGAQRSVEKPNRPPPTTVDEDSARASQEKHVGDKLSDLPATVQWSAFAIAGITVLTVIAIYKHAEMTEVGGDEDRRASEAAAILGLGSFHKQNDRLAHCGRALVLVSTQVDRHSESVVVFKIKNYGRTPAEILWIATKQGFLNFGQEPSGPPLTRPESELQNNSGWILSTGSEAEPIYTLDFDGPPFSTDHVLASDVSNGKRTTWIWGIVCYRDVITRHDHKTLFCYHFWQRTLNATVSGPPEWNLIS